VAGSRRRNEGALTRCLLLAAALCAGCAGAPERPQRAAQDLFAERRADHAARSEHTRVLIERLAGRAEAKARGGARPTLDMLIISGGGDWGAFGAGVLKGWGRAQGELARPQFDVVTGVSTGALIAPFAFLGDEASIERVVQLYRNPQPDTAVSRGLLFFLPANPSLYVLPGLERELQQALDPALLARIAAQETSGRALLVNTTNIDLGQMRAWDLVAEAKQAASDPGRVHQILLASAGIPAVFPARQIGSHLYVDGAITGNILYGARVQEADSLAALWRAKHPRTPLPRLRYWVIFNNQFVFPPQVTPQRWPDIMARATIMGTQTSTVNAMRHLASHAEVMRLKYGAEVQTRFISVPEDWLPPAPGTFQKEVMNALADLGEKMGADPLSWRTELPE
jgi:predicted acylesterase/phospholipase RssA